MKKISWLVAVALVVFQGVARAESIQGRVNAASRDAIEITVHDPQGRPYPNALTLAVDGRTRLYGMRGFEDLRGNDPVGAEVSQLENGAWHADSITLFQQYEEPASPAKPSSALQGFLGNPVARGALLGAATGAIAAETSGGKAGKGALVGAGVGAAAGLLEGLFSQPANPNSRDDQR